MKRSPLKRKTLIKRRQSSGLESTRRNSMTGKRCGPDDPQGYTMASFLKPSRQKRTKYSRRPRDTDRMAWCRTLPCALRRPGAPHPELWRGPDDVDRCRGPVEAHHAGEHGYGNKAPDDTVIPLCNEHHRCLTDRDGIFSGWPRRALKAWELALVADYQRAYAEHQAATSATLY